MTIRTKQATRKQRVSWVNGTFTVPPERPCSFERECALLGVDAGNMQAIVSNLEVVAWILANKDEKYVPSAVLSALKLRTIWDEGEVESRRLARFSVQDAESAEEESDTPAMISTR